MGAVAVYWAVSRLAVEVIHRDTAVFAYFTVSAVAFVALLLAAQRRMREET
jgi:bacteriorhodopsin